MKEVINVYRLFNLLSFDVAVGAVIGSLFFAHIYEVDPSVPSLISLGITVWIIYTADRLLDVRDIEGEAASERHRFHQRHQRGLRRCMLMAMILDIVLIFFMPANIIKHGIMLSLVVVIYIIFRRRLHLSKELLVAVLYTAGVVLPGWPANQLALYEHLPILLFFLIALINLFIFSWYEKENDLKDKQNSVATLMNERVVRYILIGLFFIAFLIDTYLFFQPVYHFSSIVFVAMTSILFFIFSYKGKFTESDYYRLVGDAVFLLPIIYILS